TQEEVEKAITQLEKAIEGLEKKKEPELDTTELERLIANAKVYEKENYTEATFNQLQQEIDKAEKVLTNATTQEAVEKSITGLQNAIDGLEKKKEPEPDPKPEIDTTELEKLIAHAKIYEKEHYTEATFNQLQQ